MFKDKPTDLKKTSMMKHFQTTFLFLFMALGFGQSTKTLSLQKFNAVKVYDRISITLVKADKNILVVTGKDKEDVSIAESKGTLKIKMNMREFLSGNHIEATLYFTEDLSLIDANENAKIISKATIKSSDLEIKAQEAGIIALELATDYVTVKSTTGSEITLSGTSKVQDVSVNTGGKVFNKNLDTKETTVTVLAGGHADILATDAAVARVKAGGSITIYGNPKSLDQDDTFGGTIKLMD